MLASCGRILVTEDNYSIQCDDSKTKGGKKEGKNMEKVFQITRMALLAIKQIFHKKYHKQVNNHKQQKENNKNI